MTYTMRNSRVLCWLLALEASPSCLCLYIRSHAIYRHKHEGEASRASSQHKTLGLMLYILLLEPPVTTCSDGSS